MFFADICEHIVLHAGLVAEKAGHLVYKDCFDFICLNTLHQLLQPRALINAKSPAHTKISVKQADACCLHLSIDEPFDKVFCLHLSTLDVIDKLRWRTLPSIDTPQCINGKMGIPYILTPC